MSKQIVTPSVKHYRKKLFLFISHAILFIVFFIATFYLNILNLWFNAIFLIYVIWFLIYLINYKSKKIILTDRSISYSSLFKKESFNIEEIATYYWGFSSYINKDYAFNLKSDPLDSANPINILTLLNDLNGFIIVAKKDSGKRKFKCFKAHELNSWLEKKLGTKKV